MTVTGAVGVAPVTRTAKLADDPGPTRIPAGRTTRSSVVVTTFVAVTLPVNPPDAVPLTVQVPEVMVERTVPNEPSVLLMPVWITAVALVSEHTPVGDALRAMVMLLGALIDRPVPSTYRAAMSLVDVPSAPIVEAVGVRMMCAPAGGGEPLGAALGDGLANGLGEALSEGEGDGLAAGG